MRPEGAPLLRASGYPPPRPQPIRLALVDPHHLVSGVLALALGNDPRLTMVAEVNDAELALAVCRHQRPDVVIMNLADGRGSSLQVLASLVTEQSTCAVLVLTPVDDDLFVAEALEVGANGYLTTEATLVEVAAGVIAVAQGQTVMAQRHVTGVVRGLSRSSAEQRAWPNSIIKCLTPRERQILRLLVVGQSTPEIANGLGITVQTTRTHIQNLLDKLGVPSRLAAAAFAVRHGVV